MKSMVRRIASAITNRSPRAYKWRYLRYLHKRYKGIQPVLVFTPGKVSSSAMAKTLLDHGIPAIHFHRMTRRGSRLVKARRAAREDQKPRKTVWKGEYARWRVQRSRAADKWLILTGVRDPIARSFSGFFQIAEAHHYVRELSSELDIAEVQSSYMRFLQDHPVDADWFTEELHPATGIDIYASLFPHVNGFPIYENETFRVLLVRFEDLARSGPRALGEFLGASSAIELTKSNVSSSKHYGELYTRFVEQVVLPDWVISDAYESTIARHFYSSSELEAFRQRWAQNV